jgi:hypothetical protein
LIDFRDAVPPRSRHRACHSGKSNSKVVAVKHKTNSRRATWLLVGAGAAMVAGRLVERGMESGWRAWKDEDPPQKPWRRGESWPQSLAWTALSAAAVATAELVARRSAHLGLRQLTGKRVPAGL